MSITVSKDIGFDAGHRLLNHEGKCRNVHGHRYTARIEVETIKGLDNVGRVVDFSVIKTEVGGWIGGRLDHGYIAQLGDPCGVAAVEAGLKVFWVDFPPTAENLAELIANKADGLLRAVEPSLRVVRVTLWETPSSFAVFEVPRG